MCENNRVKSSKKPEFIFLIHADTRKNVFGDVAAICTEQLLIDHVYS